MLLHILILHQTTTFISPINRCKQLLHILILHQTTTLLGRLQTKDGCFIFWFYIKPQLNLGNLVNCEVASYFDSTSNHNVWRISVVYLQLLHILILHQTTTQCGGSRHARTLLHILILHQTTTALQMVNEQLRCFIFWFYIKPQQNRTLDRTQQSCFIFWFYIKPQPSNVR